MFKDMGVNMVHLGEFHGDGHPKDPGPLRLPEMQAMFDECRRWSDDKLLLIPGEEANDFLGLKHAGQAPGPLDEPLSAARLLDDGPRRPSSRSSRSIPQYGKVYHVGDRGDMIRLLKEERGLAWTAHPRIKARSWTPDIFRHEDFFLRRLLAGRGLEGDARRPVAREAGRAGAEPARRHGQLGPEEIRAWARSMSSRSTTRTSCTAT